MPADSPRHLALAAQRRHELTRSKAIQALRELEAEATPVSFESVARRAKVSRSWLYTQPDLRREIERLRRQQPPHTADSPPVPRRERASDDSLRQRLEIANQRNRQLSEENKRLRHQLALALGDQRARRHTDHRETRTIGPC